MNKITLSTQKKNGEYQTWHNIVYPVKYGKMLDEQLDYASISLFQIKKANFSPLTKARLEIENNGNTEVIPYLIANDKATESPVGSGVYNHDLTLIEYTKFLEGFIVDNLCFTNQDIARVEGTAKVPPNINFGDQKKMSAYDFEKWN